MRRRDFVSFAGLLCAGFALDPLRKLWTPEPKTLLGFPFVVDSDGEPMVKDQLIIEPPDHLSSGTVRLYGSNDNKHWTEIGMLPIESERDGAGVVNIPKGYIDHRFLRVEDSLDKLDRFFTNPDARWE